MPILLEYFTILIYFFISLVIGLVMILLNYLASPKSYNVEKSSSYECGFEPFGNARLKFNIHYYLIAILFIVFDLEIIYLFPWAVNFGSLGSFGFFSVIGFLIILLFGLIYEDLKGALGW